MNIVNDPLESLHPLTEVRVIVTARIQRNLVRNVWIER